MNFYPYIKTRAIKSYFARNPEMIYGMIYLAFLLLTLGIIGGMELRGGLIK